MTLFLRDSTFDFDRSFEGVFAPSTNASRPAYTAFSPKVDIKNTETGYSILADLPAVKKEDVHVTLEDGTLSIEASTSDEHKEKDGEEIVRQERFSGSFYRSFYLGENIQESDIVANFEDGVLSLKIPKMSGVLPEKRKILIRD